MPPGRRPEATAGGTAGGNTLAKLQSTIALQELVAAVPDPHLAVDPEQIEFPDGLSTRAPASVPDGW